MAVVDAFTFNGEYDVLELRLNILDPYVDIFIIGEAEITFSGKAKPFYFEKEMQRYSKFFKKIRYCTVENYYDPQFLAYMQQQMDLKETNYPFLMAFYQKEHLQAAMHILKDDDVVYYGDCDEIWTPQELQLEPAKLEQLSYSMHLNRRSTEPWKGTAITDYKTVKKYGLNQIRQKAKLALPNGGWHFTNMGGLDELRRKINSYDHQEINTKETHAMLEERFNKGEDFLGRDYTTSIDESQWPAYLTQNKDIYKHLIWPAN